MFKERQGKFQFHTGSIKSAGFEMLAYTVRGFNSTLVRLKESFSTMSGQVVSGFNSTLVRLKGERALIIVHLDHCFNSTLVRLKEVGEPGVAYKVEFQFHTGSIKSRL